MALPSYSCHNSHFSSSFTLYDGVDVAIFVNYLSLQTHFSNISLLAPQPSACIQPAQTQAQSAPDQIVFNVTVALYSHSHLFPHKHEPWCLNIAGYEYWGRYTNSNNPECTLSLHKHYLLTTRKPGTMLTHRVH